MNKDEVANKLFEDVNMIIKASFYNATLNYNNQQNKWIIRGIFNLEKVMNTSEIFQIFENTGFQVSTPKLKETRRITVTKDYKDLNPSHKHNEV